MKELKFMGLTQGGMSVAEYIEKFEEPCKFCAVYQRNPDEHWKCMMYEEGLRVDIIASMALLEIRSYATLVKTML